MLQYSTLVLLEINKMRGLLCGRSFPTLRIGKKFNKDLEVKSVYTPFY